MRKATFGEVTQWVVLEYPDHDIGADDPGLGMLAGVIRAPALRLGEQHRTRWRKAHNQCR